MARLRIGIEAHMVGRRGTGNERVVTNLARAMHDVGDHELVMYFTDPESAESWGALGMERLTVRVLGSNNPLLRRTVTVGRACRADDIDVLLAHYSRPVLLPCPAATIVHDISFARFPEYFSRFDRLYMNRTVPWSIRHSAAVVTGSEFSRQEMIDRYDADPARITVAPYAVDPALTQHSPEPPPVDGPYFLAIGNLEPRKNLLALLRAYRRMLEAHVEIEEKLVIVGQERLLADEIYREADDLKRSGRVVFTGFVDDSTLANLLRSATAFAYPSVYEGFGLPPLEAMALGTPVIVSDIPVMVEVVGDAGLRYAPDDYDGWASGLHQLASDSELRDRLAAAGTERARGYTWERTAELVLQTLERVAEPGAREMSSSSAV